ncbi:hypothetical protein GGS24DRAFT_476736 [Hypoxylon argillaceum]|nr:hypothetical protein GGS24DRAFT_476736 [Hypoxylon argillaceum]
MSSTYKDSQNLQLGCGYTSVLDPARQRPRPPPNRRRDKPQLSCNICRRRKLRCDRRHPCSTCEKRGLASSCTYVATTTASTSPSGVQDRLRHLENLVVSYMNQNEGAGLNTSSPQTLPNMQELDASLALSDVGGLKYSGTETKYHDQNHWDSILDAVNKLKEDFGGPDEPEPEPAQVTPEFSSINSIDSPLLYGCRRCSRDEIFATVPSKELADCLVSQCFEMLELSSCAISKLDFLTQYSSFWEHPQETPIMWLGLLFSILSIGINFRELDAEQIRQGPQPDYVALGASYREKTVQCLILGEYTRCGPYVIETLLHHFTAEFMRRHDVNNEAWIILNTTVHLAMRMGYHRDPDHFKSISPYKGELRRRLWAMLFHLDIATSAQLGVPRLINDTYVDTAEPRNLLDTDFNPDSTELPPSRPDTDPTPMLIILSKLRTGRMYTVVASVVTNTQLPTYAQVLQVDRQIEDMFLQIPEYCRIKPESNFVTDPPLVLLQRIFIQMNYHKAQIILHWRYLTLANQDDVYSYSTKTTVAAALKILNLHQTMYEGLKTGGRLYSVRWRITCFFCHDYLLAMSILCFYLQRNGEKISKSELSEIQQTLRQTKMVQGPRAPMSAEMKRVAAAIESALPGILEHDSDESSTESQVLTPSESSELNGFLNEQETLDPFVGSMLPFFDPMFEGAPLFPSHINDMEAFIDSVFAGSIDPWCEVNTDT